MNAFYVTIIHRPEMVPEYTQKEAEQGKKEDLNRNTIFQESLAAALAHKNEQVENRLLIRIGEASRGPDTYKAEAPPGRQRT